MCQLSTVGTLSSMCEVIVVSLPTVVRLTSPFTVPREMLSAQIVPSLGDEIVHSALQIDRQLFEAVEDLVRAEGSEIATAPGQGRGEANRNRLGAGFRPVALPRFVGPICLAFRRAFSLSPSGLRRLGLCAILEFLRHARIACPGRRPRDRLSGAKELLLRF